MFIDRTEEMGEHDSTDGGEDELSPATLAETIKRLAEVAETDGYEPSPHAHTVEAAHANLNRTLTKPDAD